MAQTTQQRDDWREKEFIFDKFFYGIINAGVLITFGVFLAALYFGGDNIFPNAVTEVLSIIFTILVLNRYADRRQENALKQQLIMNAGSQSNEIAKDSIHQLRKRKWLSGENGILKGADLLQADLRRAKLEKANLQGADLRGAKLQGADLKKANLQRTRLVGAKLHSTTLMDTNLQGATLLGAILQGAHLEKANLQHADLGGANLQRATLSYTELQRADLVDANLQGANLLRANLQGADLRGARLNAETTLPDYTKYDPEKGLKQLDKFIDGSWYKEAESMWANKDE
jgi:uncharacterized protein YjbI with pentapeptide repeats